MPIWARLFSTSAFLTAARLGGAVAGFLTQILLARMLSAHDLGVFYSISSIAVVGALMVTLGYPNIASRFISRYETQGRVERVSAFIRVSRRESLFWGVLAATGIVICAFVVPNIPDALRYSIVVTAITIIPVASQRIYTAVAMAYRRFSVSHVPPMLIRPALFLVIVAGFWLFSVPVSVLVLIVATFLTCVASYLMQYFGLRDILRKKSPSTPRRLVRRWKQEAWPLVIVAGFVGMLSELAILLVSPFMPSADVAAFGICLKVAFMIGFTVQAAHQVLLPEMGEAVARRESHAIGSKILGASIFPVVVTGFAILASMAAGQYFLALFGPQFSAAKNTLTILLVVQFVRALAGPGPQLMTMKGAQRESAIICLVSLGVLVLGNAVLAPRYGAEGAAISVLVTTIVWLLATGIALYRQDRSRADVVGLGQRALDGRRRGASAGGA